MLFGFRPRTARNDPFSSPHSIDLWLQGRTGSDCLALLDASIELLRTDSEKDCAPQRDRVAALLRLDERLQPLQESMTLELLYARGAPQPVQNKSWQAQYECEEHFVTAYERLLSVVKADSDETLRPYLPFMLVRLAVHLQEQAKLRLYRQEQWIPGKWRSLHAAYQLALDAGVARTVVRLVMRAGVLAETTFEREHMKTLLLLKLDSGTFSAQQIKLASDYAQLWSAGLTIEREKPEDPSFRIAPSGTGLQHVTDDANGADVFYWHPSPVVQAIKQRLQALSASSEKTSDKRAHEQVLRQLMHFWSADDIKQREPRRPALNETLRVVVGFNSICEALRHPDELLTRAEGKGPAYRYSVVGLAGLYAGGRDSKAGSPYRPYESTPEEPASWRVLDQSKSGLRCACTTSDGSVLPLGSLVALMRSTEDWALALVRRVTRVGTASAQYGLELIGNKTRLVSLLAADKLESDASRLHDPAQPRSKVPVLLFEKLGQSTHASESLLVPPNAFVSGALRRLEKNHTSTVVRLRSALAIGRDWTLATIDEVRPASA